MMPRILRAALVAAATAIAAAVPAATASAGALVSTAPSCDNGTYAKPFTRWLDYASYFRVPGGDFEGSVAGWTLAGASVGAGSQSFGSGSGSLSLPAGASATTPVFCAGLEHPTNRFFLRRAAGSPQGSVRVEAITESAAGETLAVPVATVGAGAAWAPSPVVLNVLNLLPLLPGAYAPMELRYTAVGGDVWLDDVWVDPWGRG